MRFRPSKVHKVSHFEYRMLIHLQCWLSFLLVEISAGSYGTRCGALPACFVKDDVVQARRKRSTMNFMERMEVDAEHKQAYAQAGLG